MNEVFHLFCLVDSHKSMSDAENARLNVALREALENLENYWQKKCPELRLNVAILECADPVGWLYPYPMDIRSIVSNGWPGSEPRGSSNWNAAFGELNNKLSAKHGWMWSDFQKTFVVLLSDGKCTEGWTPALEKLKGNAWFKTSGRIAIAIGDDANRNLLADFTGFIESVISDYEADRLRYLVEPIDPESYPEECFFLKSSRCSISLELGKCFTEYQVSAGNSSTSTKVGEVIEKNGELGIRNLSSYTWTVQLTDGSVRQVVPGKGMPVQEGLKIKFGNSAQWVEIIKYIY